MHSLSWSEICYDLTEQIAEPSCCILVLTNGDQKHVCWAGPEEPEVEKISPRPSPEGQGPISINSSGFATWKGVVLLVLVMLVVFFSISFLVLRAHNQLPGSAGSVSSAGADSATSNGAMFGFDAQHTHFNAAEHILNVGNVSHLLPDWLAATGNVIIDAPVVANGIVYIGSYDRTLYAYDTATGRLVWAAQTMDADRFLPGSRWWHRVCWLK